MGPARYPQSQAGSNARRNSKPYGRLLRQIGQRLGSAHGGGAPRGADKPPSPGRRVNFAPGTPDPTPMRQRYGRPDPRPGWTPYIIGFCVVCLGPMRPLIFDILRYLYASIRGEPAEEEEPG